MARTAVSARAATRHITARVTTGAKWKTFQNSASNSEGSGGCAFDSVVCGINVPVRMGRAVVLPGDLVLAKHDGVIFIPASLASAAIIKAEFTNLQDAFNFELNKAGTNGAEFEGGWNAPKFAAFKKWIDAHPDKLKMTRAEFDQFFQQATAPRGGRSGQ